MSTAVDAPWQQHAYAQVIAALDAGRLPHALLVGGPPGLGKLALARRLAHRLLCSTPAGSDACGHCRNCTLLAAGSHPDLIEETFEVNEKTKELRKEILISQVRRLGEKLVLTPQISKGQVALVYPAEAMNRNAFNALLKTLEEPPAGRTLILIADRPQRLPATIRSRCQWLRLEIPPAAQALAWLQSQGHAPTAAQQALDAAQGNPGLAEQYLREDGLGLRQSVAKDLAALAQQRAGVAELAAAWIEDRPALRLRFCGELVRDHLAHRAGAMRTDALAAAGFSVRPSAEALGRWFDACARTLHGLDSPLRQDLQLAELLIGWQRLAS